jgi:hypothetical protein
MTSWVFLTASFVLTLAIVASYLFVLGNVGNYFPLPASTASGYFDSPYWLGMKRENAIAVTALQFFAAAGYIAWVVDMAVRPPTSGLFSNPAWRVAALCLFLIPSALWPLASYNMVLTPSVGTTLLSTTCLWVASIGVILMIAGTFENADASPWVIVGTLLLGNVVVLADGVGWSALAIYNALYRRS